MSDRVPREVTRWALRKVCVEEWLVLVSTVMVMYKGSLTVARSTEGDSRAFSVRVGLHQGSVSSPLLFMIAMKLRS